MSRVYFTTQKQEPQPPRIHVEMREDIGSMGTIHIMVEGRCVLAFAAHGEVVFHPYRLPDNVSARVNEISEG